MKNTGFSHFFACRFWTGAFTNRCLPYFFYSVFWRRASRPIKNRRFWPKNAPPPPGKPVTFYECHPDDHAPAPSVRADLSSCLKWRNVRPGQMVFGYVWQDAKLAIPLAIRQRYTFLQKAAANHCKTLSSVPLAFPCLSSSIPFPASSFALLSFSFPRLFLSQICALHLQNLAIDPPKAIDILCWGARRRHWVWTTVHIYILHVFIYFYIPNDLWILSTAIIKAYTTNMTTWRLTV